LWIDASSDSRQLHYHCARVLSRSSLTLRNIANNPCNETTRWMCLGLDAQADIIGR
jgi:hypothetical protein